MIHYVYSIIFSFVTFQYGIVDHAQRQRRTVVRLVVEVRRDRVFTENCADDVLLRERRYLFGGLCTNDDNVNIIFYKLCLSFLSRNITCLHYNYSPLAVKSLRNNCTRIGNTNPTQGWEHRRSCTTRKNYQFSYCSWST